MSEHNLHEELIRGISEQMKTVLESSDQAMYIYLDDIHKMCNAKFASLLGYQSPDVWAQVVDPLGECVVEGSQRTLVNAYRRAMDKCAGSSVRVTWKKKTGEDVDTNVILVPIAFNGHLFALHFLSKI